MKVHTILIRVLRCKLRNLLALPEVQRVSLEGSTAMKDAHTTLWDCLEKTVLLSGDITEAHLLRLGTGWCQKLCCPQSWTPLLSSLSENEFCASSASSCFFLPCETLKPPGPLPIKLFIPTPWNGYICRLHVYIPVTKELEKMSCVFSLRGKAHNVTTSPNTRRLFKGC